MASVSEIVRFLNSYKEMPTDQKTVNDLERIKGLIEENLQNNVYMALGHAIRLVEISNEKEWLKGIAERANLMLNDLDVDDQYDLQPMLKSILLR